MIFSLRRHRLDLVTGEAGENVFGGGLKAALDEISRLEQEYLALFLGKQYRQTVAREYNALPSKDENTFGRMPLLRYGGSVARQRPFGPSDHAGNDP